MASPAVSDNTLFDSPAPVFGRPVSPLPGMTHLGKFENNINVFNWVKPDDYDDSKDYFAPGMHQYGNNADATGSHSRRRPPPSATKKLTPPNSFFATPPEPRSALPPPQSQSGAPFRFSAGLAPPYIPVAPYIQVPTQSQQVADAANRIRILEHDKQTMVTTMNSMKARIQTITTECEGYKRRIPTLQGALTQAQLRLEGTQAHLEKTKRLAENRKRQKQWWEESRNQSVAWLKVVKVELSEEKQKVLELVQKSKELSAQKEGAWKARMAHAQRVWKARYDKAEMEKEELKGQLVKVRKESAAIKQTAEKQIQESHSETKELRVKVVRLESEVEMLKKKAELYERSR